MREESNQVNGTNYHYMLSNYVLPQLQQRPDYRLVIFMQDRTPPHYANSVKDLLNTLPVGWIGRRDTIKWAPKSPDLTPLDFFVGCYEGPSLQLQTP